MKLDTRSKKATANAVSNLINKFIYTICGFIARTILIYTLGKEYLGINGLFSSIISILSLADLGIGIALPFSLYAPLAEGDEKTVKALMKLYSKIYTVIGIVVLLLGMFLLPFLNSIIGNDVNIPNIHLIYILFVLHSALSYFWVYKRTLMIADQKGYIVNKYVNIIKIILMIVQIIVLLLFKNYILYFSTNIIFVVIENLFISKKCTKMYPYLADNEENNKLDKNQIKKIWKNSYALIFYKVCNVVLGSTDNIIISYFCGIITVGIYSNYLLILDGIQGIISQIFSAVTSSIGNLVSTKNNKKSYDVYKTLNLLCFCVFGICSICLFFLANDFINIWVGKDYIVSTVTVLIIVINFYIVGCQSITTAFRNSYGLFWQGRYSPLFAVIINIITSVILAKPLGLFGVLLGTTISRVSVTIWLEAYIVHKYGFKENIKPYYISYIKYLLVFVVLSIIEYPIAGLIIPNNYIVFFIKGIVIGTIALVYLYVVFNKTKEYIKLKEYIMSIANKKRKNESRVA